MAKTAREFLICHALFVGLTQGTRITEDKFPEGTDVERAIGLGAISELVAGVPTDLPATAIPQLNPDNPRPMPVAIVVPEALSPPPTVVPTGANAATVNPNPPWPNQPAKK